MYRYATAGGSIGFVDTKCGDTHEAAFDDQTELVAGHRFVCCGEYDRSQHRRNLLVGLRHAASIVRS